MKPLCIAHRGCHWKCYENTSESFVAAREGEFYGVETDIHLTKDKKWVIHHDDFIISGGKKFIIKNMTLNEITHLSLDNEEGYKAYCPTFTTYLSLLQNSGKRPIIEIKPKNVSYHHLRMMIKEVKQYFKIEDVTFIAFSPIPLLKLKSMFHKRVHLQQLIYDKTEFISLAYRHRFDLDIHYDFISRDIVEKFHRKNLKVNIWTVDQEKELKRMQQINVDYITTNVFDQNS